MSLEDVWLLGGVSVQNEAEDGWQSGVAVRLQQQVGIEI
jgi:hypothetical protein